MKLAKRSASPQHGRNSCSWGGSTRKYFPFPSFFLVLAFHFNSPACRVISFSDAPYFYTPPTAIAYEDIYETLFNFMPLFRFCLFTKSPSFASPPRSSTEREGYRESGIGISSYNMVLKCIRHLGSVEWRLGSPWHYYPAPFIDATVQVSWDLFVVLSIHFTPRPTLPME